MEMKSQVGLCSQQVCPGLCTRAQYCQPGQARARQLLGLQRECRLRRRFAVGQAIEANIRKAAGSFRSFQLQLFWEHQQKGKEAISCER